MRYAVINIEAERSEDANHSDNYNLGRVQDISMAAWGNLGKHPKRNIRAEVICPLARLLKSQSPCPVSPISLNRSRDKMGVHCR